MVEKQDTAAAVYRNEIEWVAAHENILRLRHKHNKAYLDDLRAAFRGLEVHG